MSRKKDQKYHKHRNALFENTTECETAPTDPCNPDDPNQPGSQDKDADEPDSQLKQILETGSITMDKGRHLIHCLTIIGQIEGHFILPPQNKTTKYEHVIPQIVAIEEDPAIEGLLVILNTVGGDVEAGLAIAELLAGMKKPTVSLVLGGGHSIGVPLAVSTKQSFIAETATMTIHPVRMNGVVLGVPQTLGYFYRMQDRITKFVCDNSSIPPKRFKELMMNTNELVMDVGTVLDGKDAVKEGLIDHLGGLSDSITCLYGMIEAQAPKVGGKGKTESKQADDQQADGKQKTADHAERAATEPKKRKRRQSGIKEDGSAASTGINAKLDVKPKKRGSDKTGSGGTRHR